MSFTALNQSNSKTIPNHVRHHRHSQTDKGCPRKVYSIPVGHDYVRYNATCDIQGVDTLTFCNDRCPDSSANEEEQRGHDGHYG